MSSLLTALDAEVRDGVMAVDGTTLRYSELLGQADSVAAEIAGMPAAAIDGAATMDTVVGVVAGLRAGVPVVPIPADAGDTERAHILADSGATQIDVAALAVAGTSSRSATVGADMDDESTAIVMYTSGTTGLPKGVEIPRRAIAAGLDGLADAWGWTADDHLAHGLPLFHVHGLILGILGPLRVGADVTHTGRPVPDRYAAAAGEGATMFFGVPTVWGRVANDAAAAKQLAGSRLLVSGSAPLPVPVFERLRELAGQVPIERYGMTETMITLSTRHDGERRPGHVGLPIAGVETRLRDEHGEPVPHDGESVGTLQVRGTTVFNGYLNLPDRTDESFTDDGWFITGDAATIGGGGMHRIVGRESVDIIKSGGYKIGAGEIETVLLGQPGVDEVAVVGLPDDDLGQRVVAFVVAGDGAPDDDELIAVVAAELSAHKRPRKIRRVDELPRNAMGKVQKQQLL